jgi:hypothetical protein
MEWYNGNMHNPLRSEADAFRLAVTIGAAAATVIAVTLLTRPAIGAAWAAALIGFGAGLAYRSARDSLSHRMDDVERRSTSPPPQTDRGRLQR